MFKAKNNNFKKYNCVCELSIMSILALYFLLLLNLVKFVNIQITIHILSSFLKKLTFIILKLLCIFQFLMYNIHIWIFFLFYSLSMKDIFH